MPDRSGNRSNKYQHVLLESPFSPDMITEFSDSQGLSGMLNASKYNEELLDLKERLLLAFWRIIDTQLTPRQRQVLRLYAQGFTQIEIAKQLNVNQSSITKSLSGNVDYRNGKKVYGGAKKKIRKIADNDPEIQEIFKRMQEIKSEMDF